MKLSVYCELENFFTNIKGALFSIISCQKIGRNFFLSYNSPFSEFVTFMADISTS